MVGAKAEVVGKNAEQDEIDWNDYNNILTVEVVSNVSGMARAPLSETGKLQLCFE